MLPLKGTRDPYLGFWEVMTLVFVALKVAGQTDISWWLVWAPYVGWLTVLGVAAGIVHWRLVKTKQPTLEDAIAKHLPDFYEECVKAGVKLPQ